MIAFGIDIHDFMYTLKEQLLPRYGISGKYNEKAIYTSFEICVSDPNRPLNRLRKSLHIVIHSPVGAQVHTFLALSDNCFARFEEVKDDFIFIASHDACWHQSLRDYIFNIYFEMCKTVNAKVAPAKLNADARFLMHRELFRLVDVSTPRDPADSNNYRRLLEFPDKSQEAA